MRLNNSKMSELPSILNCYGTNSGTHKSYGKVQQYVDSSISKTALSADQGIEQVTNYINGNNLGKGITIYRDG